MPIIIDWTIAKILKTRWRRYFSSSEWSLDEWAESSAEKWMQDHAQVLAMVTLPENLFRSANLAKTIFVFRKQEEAVVQPFVYPLTDLQDQEDLMKFRESFQKLE